MEEVIFKQMSHRLDLLTKTDAELKNRQKHSKEKVNQQELLIRFEVERLKKEIDDMLKLSSDLNKAVHHLGRQLRSKSPKKTFLELTDKVNDWKLEEFVTKDELERLFTLYSTQAQ